MSEPQKWSWRTGAVFVCPEGHTITSRYIDSQRPTYWCPACERFYARGDDKPAVMRCTYCGGEFPVPVELHHTQEECDAFKAREAAQ